jgi:thiol-disulfide isomerase/thioredoxin
MQVVLALTGLVAFATVLGMLWRASQGRVRAGYGRISDIELGGRATLLQLSTEVCSPCRATARVLDALSGHDIRHVEIDIADRPDLVSRFNVLQTPTTLILDREGTVRARIGGAVRRDAIVAALQKVA